MLIIFLFPIADISENRLVRIDNLDALPSLSTLNVSKNALSTAEGVENLSRCKKLSSVDFSHNALNGEDVIEALARVSTLLSINLTGNPVTGEVPHFRKKMIVTLKCLRYLDRPVFDLERASAEAWSTGGRDAELKVKLEWQENKKTEHALETQSFRDWQNEIRNNAILEKQRFEEHDPTPDQLKKLEAKKKREEKAEMEAAREREIYRIDIPFQSDTAQNNNSIEPAVIEIVDDDSIVSFSSTDSCELDDDCKQAEMEDFSEDDISSLRWSDIMDYHLKKLVRVNNYDFANTSTLMQEEFTMRSLSAEACRLRWCLLDSASSNNMKPLDYFLSDEKTRATFEEIPVGHTSSIVRPTSFPSCVEDEEHA